MAPRRDATGGHHGYRGDLIDDLWNQRERGDVPRVPTRFRPLSDDEINPGGFLSPSMTDGTNHSTELHANIVRAFDDYSRITLPGDYDRYLVIENDFCLLPDQIP